VNIVSIALLLFLLLCFYQNGYTTYLCLDGDLFYFAEYLMVRLCLFGSCGKLSCRKSFKFSIHHVLNVLSMGKTNLIYRKLFQLMMSDLKQKHKLFGRIM
jgi:hypothetical protein